MKREIIDYFKKNKDEMIKAISELVAVPSVRGTAEEGKPFGKKPYEALMLALKKAESFLQTPAGHFLQAYFLKGLSRELQRIRLSEFFRC